MLSRLFLIIAFFFVLFFSVVPQSAHAQIYTTGKLITVDLQHQMLYAWEGGHIVFQTVISSGLPHTPTVKGTFHTYIKYPYQEMKGTSVWYGPYDLPNVPNVMYFYQDYAIHGAYWHNNFGHPMSHGCVNTPVPASAWLYNWAPVGTTVIIY